MPPPGSSTSRACSTAAAQAQSVPRSRAFTASTLSGKVVFWATSTLFPTILREVNFNWSGKQSLSTGVGLKTPRLVAAEEGRVYGGVRVCGCAGFGLLDHSHVLLSSIPPPTRRLVHIYSVPMRILVIGVCYLQFHFWTNSCLLRSNGTRDAEYAGAAVDLSNGMVLNRTKLPSCGGVIVEQRWYAHRSNRSVLVYEMELVAPHSGVTPSCTVMLSSCNQATTPSMTTTTAPASPASNGFTLWS